MSSPTGLNPIKKPTDGLTDEDRRRVKLREAVSLVATAAREGFLTEDELTLLNNGGVRPVKATQSAKDMLEALLAFAQMLKDSMRDQDGKLTMSYPAEIGQSVNSIVKLMELVRTSMSEARRYEELAAIESSLHECITDIQDGVDGNKEAAEAVDSALKRMQLNLEDRMRVIQKRFEE